MRLARCVRSMINAWKLDYSAVHDGPGMRTSIYLKGCPLRCVWCSNPEGQRPEPDLVFIQIRCIECGQCTDACHAGAIDAVRDAATGKSRFLVDRERCDLCGECVAACTPKALELWGRDYTIPELAKILEKNRGLYRRSGGGVTLTGGDPLYQWEPTGAFLDLCKDMGIHTAVETSGYAEEEPFERIARSVDLLFIDLKHMDPDEHVRLTGRKNDAILRNLRRASSVLGERGRDPVVRMVVVPGVNDGENLERAARFLSFLPYLKTVEFLPYHRYGATKYDLLRLPYRLADKEPPSEELMENCRKAMMSFGIKNVC